MARWLLPENIADVLPSEARRIENLRRSLLDLFRAYGYELVIPPLIEHLDSLLTGSGRELGSTTFQLVDQLSGRTLGVRADMTPQVARIDAHLLDRVGVTRLCYSGSTLHTRPAGIFASREPLQIGAELFGHAGIEADLEIIELMVQALGRGGVSQVRIDLCHMGIVPALFSAFEREVAALDLDAESLYGLLLSKDLPGLRERLGKNGGEFARACLALPHLYGQVEAGDRSGVIESARHDLPRVPAVGRALDDLERLCASPTWRRHPGVALSIDLADLRGYRYHNGVSFAAYVDGRADALGRGGRYDGVGKAFGRARAATGFSLELRELASMLPGADPDPAIRAPWSDDAALAQRVAELRAAGHVVIQALPGHEEEQQEFACDRELVLRHGRWELGPLKRVS
jgi:ATP phosphoribosyltransferase regulatory subunit